MIPIGLELGVGYVSIVASGRGFAQSLNNEIGDDLDRAGRDAGDRAGGSFSTAFGAGIKRAVGAAAVAFAGLEIGQFALGAIESASNLNEVVSKTGQIFGQEALPGLEAFAAGASRALGQSKTQALDAAATFAVFGKSAGLSGAGLTGFSTDLVKLTSDMASFSNTTPEEAIEAVGAALRGESEPIRRYGVLLDDATLRQRALALGLIATTKDALTPQQRVLAAQAEILAQTGDAQGDFARTSDGLANRQRILAAELENGKAALGEKLLPAAVAVTGFILEKVIPAFEGFAGKVKEAFGEGGIGGVGQVLGEQLEAIGPQILPALRSVFGAIGDFVTANGPGVLRGLRDAFLAIGDFLSTEAFPALLKGAGLLLVALGAWIATTAAPYLWSQIRDNWAPAFSDWLMGTAWPALQQNLPVFVDQLGRWIEAGAPILAEKLRAWGLAFGDWLASTAIPWAVVKSGEFLAWLQDWITGTALPAIWEKVAAWALALTDWFVTQAIPWGLDKANQFIDAIIGWVTGTALPYLVDKGPEWAAAFVNWITDEAVPSMLGQLGELWGRFTGWVSGKLGEIRQRGSDLASDFISGLGNGLESFFGQRVVPFFAGLPGRVAGMVAGAGGWLVGAGQAIIGGLANGAESFMGYLFGVFNGLPGRIRNAVGDLGGVLYGAGRSIISGLVSGITDAIPGVQSALNRVTNLIPSWKGPADVDRRLLRPSGQMILEGLVAGFGDVLPKVEAELGTVTNLVQASVPVSVTRSTPTPVPAPTAAAGGDGVMGQANLYIDGRKVAETMVRYQRGLR